MRTRNDSLVSVVLAFGSGLVSIFKGIVTSARVTGCVIRKAVGSASEILASYQIAQALTGMLDQGGDFT